MKQERRVAVPTSVGALIGSLLALRFHIRAEHGLWPGLGQVLSYFSFWMEGLVAACALSVVAGRGPFTSRLWIGRALLAAVLTILAFWVFAGWHELRTAGVHGLFAHFIVPMLTIWLWVSGRERAALRWRDLPLLPGFAFSYTLFMLVRGTITGTYPYDILDVHLLGYRIVLLTIAVTLVGHWVFGAGMILSERIGRDDALVGTDPAVGLARPVLD